MVVKKRGPQLRYVPRTHRIDIDGLFELIHSITVVSIMHIGSRMQIADTFIKGMFTVFQVRALTKSCLVALQNTKKIHGNPAVSLCNVAVSETAFLQLSRLPDIIWFNAVPLTFRKEQVDNVSVNSDLLAASPAVSYQVS